MDFTVSAEYRVKIKESKKVHKYLDLARELKKAVEHEGDGDTNCNWCTWNDPQRLRRNTGRIGNERKNEDHPNDSIVENCQNTKNALRTNYTKAKMNNTQQNSKRRTCRYRRNG